MERGPCASAALFVLGFLPLAALARAAPREPAAPADARPFHLSYDASAPSCPDAPAFRAAIRARTDRARLAGEREKATTFAVRITAGPDERVVGELTIHEPDGAPRVRTMESETCGDVARAIALVVALVLDPDADTSADPPLPVPEGPDGPDAPRPPPASPPPTANPSSAATGPPPSPAPATVRVGVGGAIGVLGGVGPSVAPLAGAFVEAERAGAGPSWFRPTARLAVDLATVAGDHGVGSQRYLWLAATARVCPVQLPVGTSVRGRPLRRDASGQASGDDVGFAECPDLREALARADRHRLPRLARDGTGDARAAGRDRRPARPDALLPRPGRHAVSRPGSDGHGRGQRYRSLSSRPRHYFEAIWPRAGIGSLRCRRHAPTWRNR